MFKRLFDLSVKRSGSQIFGFYLVYSFLGAFAAGIICGIIISVLHFGLLYGPAMAVIYGVIISLLIIKEKGIFNSFKAVLLTIASVPLLYFGGVSIGMIPVAFLTSLDSEKDEE